MSGLSLSGFAQGLVYRQPVAPESGFQRYSSYFPGKPDSYAIFGDTWAVFRDRKTRENRRKSRIDSDLCRKCAGFGGSFNANRVGKEVEFGKILRPILTKFCEQLRRKMHLQGERNSVRTGRV